MSNLLLNVLAWGAFTMQAAPTPAPTPAPAPPPTPAAKSAEKPAMTLSGCLTKDPEAPGTYTFADSKTGAKYRLSSTGTQTTTSTSEGEQGTADTRKNDWKRGEFVLGHVTIRGGLVPSATIAGQQSALDPAKAATANLPGGTSASTGTVGLPEFRATQIRASKGACP